MLSDIEVHTLDVFSSRFDEVDHRSTYSHPGSPGSIGGVGHELSQKPSATRGNSCCFFSSCFRKNSAAMGLRIALALLALVGTRSDYLQTTLYNGAYCTVSFGRVAVITARPARPAPLSHAQTSPHNHLTTCRCRTSPAAVAVVAAAALAAAAAPLPLRHLRSRLWVSPASPLSR